MGFVAAFERSGDRLVGTGRSRVGTVRRIEEGQRDSAKAVERGLLASTPGPGLRPALWAWPRSSASDAAPTRTGTRPCATIVMTPTTNRSERALAIYCSLPMNFAISTRQRVPKVRIITCRRSDLSSPSAISSPPPCPVMTR